MTRDRIRPSTTGGYRHEYERRLHEHPHEQRQRERDRGTSREDVRGERDYKSWCRLNGIRQPSRR